MFYKDEVIRKTQDKPHLIPIFSSVYHIPERLREYDPEFFIVFNTKRQKFEIHSLEQPFETYCLTIPFEELDIRTLQHLWKNDLRLRGSHIFQELEAEQARMEKDQEKQFRQWARDVAKETQPLMAKTAWT